ncbi:hypothetical protein B0H14DRAFT_3424462 [Mycena olivaceomarginata]|nr:hypothetical protein B0H14DRAFT_3424462 [Mycena olivaceomarginata]
MKTTSSGSGGDRDDDCQPLRSARKVTASLPPRQDTGRTRPGSGWIETTATRFSSSSPRAAASSRASHRLVDQASLYSTNRRELFAVSGDRKGGEWAAAEGSDEGEEEDDQERSESGRERGQWQRESAKGRQHTLDRQRERTLVGSLTNNYKFKAAGLMKKTFSVTNSGVAQHLISQVSDVESGSLRAASSLPELSSLDTSPTLLDRDNFRGMPKMEVCPSLWFYLLAFLGSNFTPPPSGRRRFALHGDLLRAPRAPCHSGSPLHLRSRASFGVMSLVLVR